MNINPVIHIVSYHHLTLLNCVMNYSAFVGLLTSIHEYHQFEQVIIHTRLVDVHWNFEEMVCFLSGGWWNYIYPEKMDMVLLWSFDGEEYVYNSVKAKRLFHPNHYKVHGSTAYHHFIITLLCSIERQFPTISNDIQLEILPYFRWIL